MTRTFPWKRLQVPAGAPEGGYVLTLPAGEHGVLHDTNGAYVVQE